MAYKSAKLYSVKEEGADRDLGAYYAMSGKAAIQRFLDDQATHASTFRRGCPMPKFRNLIAVEKEPYKD